MNYNDLLELKIDADKHPDKINELDKKQER